MQEEIHYCFMCSKPLTVIFPVKENISSNPESCPTCGFFKCPSCGKCACDLGEEGKKVLNAFWDTYCSGSCRKKRRK